MGVIQLHRRKGRDTIIGTAGEDLAKYDLVYTKSGTWWKADRDAVATLPAVGMCTGAISAGDRTYIILWGPIGNPDWTWVDGPIYSSGTAGGLTQTPPAASGYVQSVGYAYGATFMLFSPTWIKQIDETRTHTEHLPAGALGRPNTNPADPIAVDNTLLMEFDVDTDMLHFTWDVSEHYVTATDLMVRFHWTNDGGVDDNGKNVTAQLSYVAFNAGETVAGNHANSPRTVNDAYTSDAGSISHTTPDITIPAADFAGKHHIHFMVMFVTAPATALTGKPRLDAMELEHTEYIYL